MVLLPLFCASAFAPSITPEQCGKASAKRHGSYWQRRRLGPAGRPVEQLDGMDDRNAGARRRCCRCSRNCRRRSTSGLTLSMLADLAVAQAARQLGLQHLVGAGPAAAEMALGHVLHDEARVAQQLLGLLDHLLAVLHRAGRMIGDGERPRGHVRETDLDHDLADVPGERRDRARPSPARPDRRRACGRSPSPSCRSPRR